MLRRFSATAIIAVSLIMVTGIFATFATVYRPAHLIDTTYGLTLVSKWVLMLPLLGLAALHYVLLSPERQQKAAAWLQAHQFFAKLPQSIRLEAVFALLVLMAGSLLPATPPPVPPNARGEVSISSQQLEVKGYQVELSAHPATVGINSFDVHVLHNDAPAELDSVSVRLSLPRHGHYTEIVELEETEPGVWVGAGGDINRAATWDTLLDLTPPNGDTFRAAFQIGFVREVEDGSSRRPSLLHYLSALAILAVMGVWGAPLLYRYGSKLDWRPEIVAATALAVLLTAGVTIAGTYLFQQTGQQIQEQRDAPPDRVNTVFADQASIEQGQAIYEAHCLECHGVGGLDPTTPETPSLPEALADRDDEALYRSLSRGIIGQHQYGIDLSEPERWSLINYLRLLE